MFVKVIDVINSPWAILPSSLEQIHEIYLAKLAGRETDWLKEARANGADSFEAKEPATTDGIATITVRGPIAQRMNMLSSISGGASTSDFARQVQAAADDPAVTGILLEFDSPGGSVLGLQRAAEIVRAARAVKPVVAWTDATMASAAYYLGSAATRVFIDANDTIVGSIGVVAKHVDTSGMEEKAGVKVTEITAGKYKRIASQHAPLSKEGRATIQEEVDHYYVEFVDAIAENRGVDVKTVLESMADGRVFIGTKAIDAGLVDAVATKAEAIQFLQSQALEKRAAKEKEYRMNLTPEQVKADAPDVAKALQAEGAMAERARIAAIDAAAFDGQAELVAKLKAEGVTAGDAVVQLNIAQKAALKVQAESQAADRSAIAKAREDDASKPLPSAATKAEQGDEPKQSPLEQAASGAARARAYQLEMAQKGINVSASEAVMHVMKEGA